MHLSDSQSYQCHELVKFLVLLLPKFLLICPLIISLTCWPLQHVSAGAGSVAKAMCRHGEGQSLKVSYRGQVAGQIDGV